jgi:hypothetical protein
MGNRGGLSYSAVNRIGTKMRQVAVMHAAAGGHQELLYLLYKACMVVGWNSYQFQECMLEGHVIGGHADLIGTHPDDSWHGFIPFSHLRDAHRKAVHSKQPVVARKLAELIRRL